jgi:hypothetical protein
MGDLPPLLVQTWSYRVTDDLDDPVYPNLVVLNCDLITGDNTRSTTPPPSSTSSSSPSSPGTYPGPPPAAIHDSSATLRPEDLIEGRGSRFPNSRTLAATTSASRNTGVGAPGSTGCDGPQAPRRWAATCLWRGRG